MKETKELSKELIELLGKLGERRVTAPIRNHDEHSALHHVFHEFVHIHNCPECRTALLEGAQENHEKN